MRACRTLPGTEHAPDFAHVHWAGRRFDFPRPGRRAVVAVLWDAWVRGAAVPDAVLLTEAGLVEASPPKRLHTLFDRGRHPAWATLIVPATIHHSLRWRDLPGHWLLA